MPPDPLRASSDDRCPGALRLHQADDGHLARIRVPGGRLTSAQLVALCQLAERLGDGVLHLTSRGNLQVRGLPADSGADVATSLQDAGLLPSLAHDRVRNVVASPHGGPVLEAALRAFDEALLADPRLTALSGRFLFGLDDGSGDVLALDPDLAVRPAPPAPLPAEVAAFVPRGGDFRPSRWQLVVAGRFTDTYGDPAALLTTAARRFLDLRDACAPQAWRVHDLDAAGQELLATAAPSDDEGRHLEGRSLPPRGTEAATSAGTTGTTGRAGRAAAVEAWVPLGSAPTSAWRAVAGLADRVTTTPWRSVVLPEPHDREEALISLQATGFSLDPTSDIARTTACIGAPGCGKALADVRLDAARLATQNPGARLHVSGCERRCGHPTGTHLEAVATTAGYQIQER
jgi:precorrin-3B synthase